jgi:hypothetical protein
MALKMFSGYSPATQALEVEQNKTMVSKGSRRGSNSSEDSKLSGSLFALNFEDTVHAFPAIEWDSNEDSDDSESVRSIDSWSSFLSDLEESSSQSDLGSKRGRGDSRSSSRRLVRSKKIKSDLASLAHGM